MFEEIKTIEEGKGFVAYELAQRIIMLKRQRKLQFHRMFIINLRH